MMFNFANNYFVIRLQASTKIALCNKINRFSTTFCPNNFLGQIGIDKFSNFLASLFINMCCCLCCRMLASINGRINMLLVINRCRDHTLGLKGYCCAVQKNSFVLLLSSRKILAKLCYRKCFCHENHSYQNIQDLYCVIITILSCPK